MTRDSAPSNYEPYPEDYPLLEVLTKYSRAVLKGKVVACQKHKWACQRFLSDLKRQGKKDFPYIFDESKALRFLDWMRLFKHRSGILKGQYIDPHIIQQFVFGQLFGWIHKDTGYRRFRKLYWQVGRKNAKSQSLACVGTYELMADEEGASEIYCGATKSKQARIVWKEAAAQLRNCPDLKGRWRIAYGQILHPKSDSIMEALSKDDKKSGDGLNPQCGIIDEFHAHETTEMYDILAAGQGARAEPILAIITSAGFDLSHPCYSVEYGYVSRILNPDDPVVNEEYLVMVNELDKDVEGNLVDNIADERIWEKANPILASYAEGREYLRARLKEAQDVPEKMRDFLTKNLCVWIQQKEHGYMNMAKWAKAGADIDPESLRGRDVYIGIDLSSKIALTSVAFNFPPVEAEPDASPPVEGKLRVVLQHSFMPQETYTQRIAEARYPWDSWRESGCLELTDGAEVDEQVMEDYIDATVQKYGWIPKEVCLDRWNAGHVGHDLTDRGYTVVEIIQGMQTLSGPTKDLRGEVYSGKVLHNRDPVLSWAMGNAIVRQDHNLNIMLDKDKSRECIDPVAAILDAHVRAMVQEPSGIQIISA